MTLSDARAGGAGYVVDAKETTAGVYAAPANAYPVTDAPFKAPWTFNKEKTMRGTPLTHTIHERSFLEPVGDIVSMINPALGNHPYEGLLGGTTTISAVAPVQTTAGNTTSNGKTQITVAGAFTVGNLIWINCSSAGAWVDGQTEARAVMSDATGVVTVGACKINATATTGIYITQKATVEYALSVAGSLYTLPSYTIEVNYGGQFAWGYLGNYVGGGDFEFGKDKFQQTIHYQAGLADPYFANGVTTPAMSAYSPSSSAEANALRPFTAIDGFLVAGGDPDATGTSTTRAVLGITDAKITYNNALLAEYPMGNGHNRVVYPGDDRSCMVSYNEIATSKRNDVWNDFIAASQRTQFILTAVKNYGTGAVPNIGGMSFYIPQLAYETDEIQQKINTINKFARSGEALVGGGVNDYLRVFVQAPS